MQRKGAPYAKGIMLRMRRVEDDSLANMPACCINFALLLLVLVHQRQQHGRCHDTRLAITGIYSFWCCICELARTAVPRRPQTLPSSSSCGDTTKDGSDTRHERRTRVFVEVSVRSKTRDERNAGQWKVRYSGDGRVFQAPSGAGLGAARAGKENSGRSNRAPMEH